MKYLIATIALSAWIVLCGFQQPSSPQGDANQKAPNPAHANTDTARPNTLPSPPSSASKSDAQTNGIESHGKQNIQVVSAAPENSDDLVERIISIIGVACTIALAVVGIYGIVIALRTIGEMKQQREVTILQLRSMNEQLSEMSQQTAFLKEYVGETKTIATATKESASAAKLSAEIAVGTSVPTLVVHEFDTGESGAASMEALLQFPTIKLVIKNYGQTPALLHSWAVIFTCEKLPKIPVYFGFPGSGMVFEKEAIQPNESYLLPRIPTWHRQEFSAEDVKMILSRDKMLTVYGYIAYRDIFGNPLRRMKFCETALNLFDGPSPVINWSDFGFSAYTGTDQYPFPQPFSGQGTDGQPSRAAAKTENSPEEAN